MYISCSFALRQISSNPHQKMNIQKLLKKLTTKEKAQIKALQVRELDEEEPGHFVAFVDEGEETYDVHIQIKEENVVQMTCDCEQTTAYCTHQAAVLVQLTQKGSKVAPTQEIKKRRTKAKQSISGALLDEQSKETIVQWLTEVFKKNKALEQQFVVTFSQEKIDYTPEYVADILQQTFKAVAGKRKTLEGVKIKKILDTLSIAFEPVNDFITVNIDKPLAYQLFSTIMMEMQAFDKRISHHSKKFSNFYQEYSTWFALTINNMQNQQRWQLQLEQLMNGIFLNDSPTKTIDCVLLKTMYDHADTAQQKVFAQVLSACMLKTSHTRYDFKMDFVSFVRDVTLTHDCYDELHSFFKVSAYE